MENVVDCTVADVRLELLRDDERVVERLGVRAARRERRRDDRNEAPENKPRYNTIVCRIWHILVIVWQSSAVIQTVRVAKELTSALDLLTSVLVDEHEDQLAGPRWHHIRSRTSAGTCGD